MSDYGGFGAIIREARENDANERDRKEVACPLCGKPLDENKDGVTNCPMGHYRGRV